MDSKPVLNLDIIIDIPMINNEYPQMNKKDFFPITPIKKEIAKKRKREELLVTDN